jgi:RNA polymerase sigma-70 factor (ECF subfamily)
MDGFRRDRPGDSFRGWLWTIARNKVRDHFRRWKDEPHAIGGSDVQKRMAELPDLSEDLSSISSDEDDRRILLQELMNALRQEIEKRTWTAFWRTTIDGHSSADVARDLGMSTKAVRQAKYRVLQRIRMELEGLEDMFVG